MTVLLRATGMVKRYGGAVPALDGANLTLRAGSIHALLGENGAGKSTLVKAVTGVHQLDEGRIELRGEPVTFARPVEASRAGIGVVHQERNVIPGFSVAENVCLQDPPVHALGWVDRRKQRTTAVMALDRLGVAIRPDATVADCSVAQVQLIEIAKALAVQSDVLILDEPTSSLTERETAQLFEVLRHLRDAGAAIVLVSHKLEEVFELCDTVTVLRDGKSVVEGEPLSNYRQKQIVDVMVGRSLAQREVRHRTIDRSDPPKLAFDAVSTELGHEGVSFDVARGEVFGLYGLVGAGRSELARSAIGQYRITGGEVRIDGHRSAARSVRESVHRFGMGYLSEDRKNEGVFLDLAIRPNIAVTLWSQISSILGVSTRQEAAIARQYIDAMGVRTRGDFQLVGQLSGGNQQKVSAAKWLASRCQVLFIDEPTVGVDVRTKDEMHQLILDLADAGTTVVLISSDLPEMIVLADRVGVMNNFKLLTILENTKEYASMSQKILGAIHATEIHSDRGSENVA